MNTIEDRLSALRNRMGEHGLTHYVVPSADENINEYLPAWRQRRPWVSGFTGSAGDLLVTVDEAGTWLFTDGRYHLQAEQELRGSGIGLQKVGTREALTLGKMLEKVTRDLGDRCVVGFDPMVLPVQTAEALGAVVDKGGGRFQAVADNLVDAIWTDRPAPPVTPLVACPVEWTGAGFAEKVDRVREALDGLGADAVVAVRLDQIAWLTNLRSFDDVPFNPVFESYLYLDRDSVHLFLHGPEKRLPERFGTEVAGFEAHAYEEFVPFLGGLRDRRVLVDPERTTAGVLVALEHGENIAIVRRLSPIESAKAIKNETELRGMQTANLLASVAKTRALIWLRRKARAGDEVTERSFLDRIESFYAEIDGYRGQSFTTISSTGPHGAIIHYGSADATVLRSSHLFLIDSGIQVDGGTTDATRTVPVGDPTEEQRRRYTLVLKSHIRAASQVFPENTPGTAIDAIARAPLWAEQLNYDHGTGHGVGAFLCVHEGPFSLAEQRRKPFAVHGLRPGMVTSIEPGHYVPGDSGIRIENLYFTDPTGIDAGDGVTWLRFTPLTWVPLERRLIDESLLDESERAWLRWYHDECRARLLPHLTADERADLERMLG